MKNPSLLNFSLKVLLSVIYITGVLASFAYAVARFTVKTFGDLPISQVLFHLNAGGASEAINEEIASQLWKCSGIFAALFLILSLLFASAVSPRFRHGIVNIRWIRSVLKVLSDWRVIFLIVAVVITAVTTHYVEKKFHVSTYFTRQYSDWFEQHYAVLDPTQFAFAENKKRNLLVIFLESMEVSYRDDKVFGENLIPELEALEKEGGMLRGYHRTPGGFFTLDGLSAMLLGIPVIAQDFNIHNIKNQTVLSGAPSIFNLLQKAGYVTANFSGVSQEFTSKRLYFAKHGIEQGYFKEDWLKSGYELNASTQGTWDFNDQFLWERLKEWLDKAGKSGKPFAAVFETVDTHQPNGWVPDDARKFYDLRDAIRLSSKMTMEFIDWAKRQSWYKDTVILVAGDHPWQDAPTSPFTKLAKSGSTREIYNVFLNSPYLPAGKVLQPAAGYTPMDVAPTILASLGIAFTSTMPDGSVSHSRLGLGTNLLSGEPTLFSTVGMKPYEAELLNKRSKLYEELFW